ncbi:hypothetical protein PC128_g20649 [Phytophthora cactorum]|nr:hypothetical protein PC120_g19430 [Phytophthora cactorum]KAG3162174.1 hypothetical protein PC128_g20649 [Phytophthora cactorum]KAG4044702.1 hypothetical protein PC123_g19869 [Phytophthora cactorum]
MATYSVSVGQMALRQFVMHLAKMARGELREFAARQKS